MLPRVVSSWIWPCAIPERRVVRAAAGPTAVSATLSAARRGCCLGHRPSPVQRPCFHAGQRVCMLPAGGVGPARAPFAAAVGITSRSESEYVSSGGGALRLGLRVPAL